MATAPAALDAYREEADRFIAALDEEYYLHFAGLKEDFELTPIYERHADLATLDACRSLGEATELGDRGAIELWRFACEGYMGDLTRSQAEELAHLEASLTVEVDGEEIGFRLLRPALANEPDRDRRERLDRARVELSETQLNPHYVSIEGGWASRSRRLGAGTSRASFARPNGTRASLRARWCRRSSRRSTAWGSTSALRRTSTSISSLARPRPRAPSARRSRCPAASCSSSSRWAAPTIGTRSSTRRATRSTTRTLRRSCRWKRDGSATTPSPRAGRCSSSSWLTTRPGSSAGSTSPSPASSPPRRRRDSSTSSGATRPSSSTSSSCTRPRTSTPASTRPAIYGPGLSSRLPADSCARSSAAPGSRARRRARSSGSSGAKGSARPRTS